jgi:hypothetical protein
MSVCQFLALFERDNLVLLLGKHGLQTDELANKSLRRNTVPVPQALGNAIVAASEPQIGTLLDELARTRSAMRVEISPKYLFDERWDDLCFCLELDSYRLEKYYKDGRMVERFIDIEPKVGGLLPVDDDLALEIGRTKLPDNQQITRLIESSAASFRSKDFNACLSNVRVALETLAKAIAKARLTSHAGNFDGTQWGAVIKYLQTSDFITDRQEKGLAGVYGFISEGAHKPLGFEDHEFARLGRTFALASCYFLAKRFNADS